MNRVKKYYLKYLMKFCFDKSEQDQEPTQTGRIVLPFLPHPKIKWLNGYEYRPYYLNRRWLKKSFQGAHEPTLEKFIIEAIPNKSTVVDVGAQVGLISVLLGMKVGSTGRVLAFEPNPYNLQVLNKALQGNKLPHVQTIDKALGKTNGFFHFRRTDQASYRQISDQGGDKVEAESERVEVARLDDFCENEGIDKVDFIKIDIDGPDFEALLGAERILRSTSKPLICMEMSHYWKDFGYEFADAFDYLNDLGYSLFIARRKHDELVRVEDPFSIPAGWGVEPKNAFNFYAWQEEVHQHLVRTMLEK